jgi:hypothetical protein
MDWKQYAVSFVLSSLPGTIQSGVNRVVRCVESYHDAVEPCPQSPECDRAADFVAGGPKGRHEIATSVRAWWEGYPKVSKARRADTFQCRVRVVVPRLRRSINLDWFLIHDLTVVATTSRPFGPESERHKAIVLGQSRSAETTIETPTGRKS